MSIGKRISNIRKEERLTQERFGELFHVTRQTVSNWENEKSYPDLQTLIGISDHFGISLDILLKEDKQMVKTMDQERMLAAIRQEKSWIDFFSGTGTGILASCLYWPDSSRKMTVLILGLVLLVIGWYKRSRYDQMILKHLENHEAI